MTLLSENRISTRRAAVLSYIANSMLNARREERLADQAQAKAEESQPLQIDWTGVPRPDRESKIVTEPAM
jgi:hypothetical protein